MLDSKLLALEKVHTDNNGAVMLTKALIREKLEICRFIVGMTNSSTKS